MMSQIIFWTRTLIAVKLKRTTKKTMRYQEETMRRRIKSTITRKFWELSLEGMGVSLISAMVLDFKTKSSKWCMVLVMTRIAFLSPLSWWNSMSLSFWVICAIELLGGVWGGGAIICSLMICSIFWRMTLESTVELYSWLRIGRMTQIKTR